jgi:hypothetical protein
MKLALAVAPCLAGMLLTGMPAAAHHSIAGDYFTSQRTTVEGDLVQFLYRNPHSFVEVKGKDPKTGEPVTWSVEWNGSGRLGREGITADTLKPGDHVVIVGQPGRNPEEHRLHMLTITRTSDNWEWQRRRR